MMPVPQVPPPMPPADTMSHQYAMRVLANGGKQIVISFIMGQGMCVTNYAIDLPAAKTWIEGFYASVKEAIRQAEAHGGGLIMPNSAEVQQINQNGHREP